MQGNLPKKQFWLLVFCAYACMMGQGFIDNVRSVTYPLMRNDLSLSFTQYGAMQALAQFSYLVWSLVVAISLQHFGFKIVIVCVFIISIIGSILTSISYSFLTLFVYQFIACAGMGGLDDAPHAMSSILFVNNTGVLMLLLHSCYGIGAVIGPAFSRLVYTIIPKQSFRGISLWMNVPLLVLALAIVFIPFAIKKPKTKEQEESKSGMTVSKALLSPMVWFQSLILVLMTTGERATSAWGGLYIEDVLHLDPTKEGAWFNSCFYIAFTVARVVGGFLVDFIGPFFTEYIVLLFSIIIFVVGLLIGKSGLFVLPFAGATVSFFWPTFIVTCMRYWKEDAAVPISCILPIQALIGVAIQYGLGVLNDRFGPKWAYWSTVPTISVAFALLILYHCILLNKEKREAQSLLTHSNKDAIAVTVDYN